jgi:hypothetical protein
MPTENDNMVSKNDGSGLPAVVEYETQSGVLIYVTPLSLFTVQAVVNRSELEYPYPDEKPYRVESELFASGFIPASENEEYQALCQNVDQQRAEWQNDAFIELACEYPKHFSREAMIAHFRPHLEKLRQFIDMGKDDWQNVLNYCVFTGTVDVIDMNNKRHRTSERHRVIQIARQNSNLQLSMSEVVEGLRVFRLVIHGDVVGKVAGTRSRRAEE